jgi:hypothetical protein
LKTITIDVSSENLAQFDNPLLFRVTVLMKTGTIQAKYWLCICSGCGLFGVSEWVIVA